VRPAHRGRLHARSLHKRLGPPRRATAAGERARTVRPMTEITKHEPIFWRFEDLLAVVPSGETKLRKLNPRR
jgi:hypothetical protein